MSVFNSSVFCFIFSVCVVTGQALAAVIVDPSNSAFHRASTSGLGALSGSGFGDSCPGAYGESLAPDWLANAASVQMDFGSIFGETFPETRNPSDTFGFWIHKTNTDFSATVEPEASETQRQANVATVLFVDGAFAIESFYPFAKDRTLAADAVSPASGNPLPSALSLFLIGLAGLGFLTWRRGRRPSL